VCYRCEYHFVFVPKYRYKVLIGEAQRDLEKILQQLCDWLDIILIEGAICGDHVHLYLSVPPKLSPSYVMKILKGKSAERLRNKNPKLKKEYWGRNMWSRGYFVSTVGVDKFVIQNYIKSQLEEELKERQMIIWKRRVS